MKWMTFLEGAYYVSGIVIAVGLIVAFFQLRATNKSINLAAEHIELMKKDMNDRNRRASVEKSLEYLQLFALDLIPDISAYQKNIDEELKDEKRSIPNEGDIIFEVDISNLEIHEIKEIIVKQEIGIVHILNRLEMFSAGVLNGLADEDLVYTPIAGIFCRFVQREYIYISILRNEGTPYKNLIELYSKWYNKSVLDDLNLQKEELEDKIKEQGKQLQNSKKPIGVTN